MIRRPPRSTLFPYTRSSDLKEEVDPSYVEPGEPSSYSGSKIWNGCLGRIGVGCALIIYDNFGISGEAAYNVGFGDLDTLRFVSLTMGFFREFQGIKKQRGEG